VKHQLPAVFLILLLIAAPVSAEIAFQVLGSFVEPEAARKEGSRIAAETGLEILLYETRVQDRLQYRLLTGVPEDPVYVEQQIQRLMQAGIADTWTLRLPDELPFMETVFAELDFSEIDLAELEMPDDEILDVSDIESAPVSTTFGNHVVAGSFREAGRAEALVARLSLLDPVTIAPVDISGFTYQRVLVGPVSPDEEASVIARLAAQGVEGAWVLRSGAAVTPQVQENQDITPQLRGLRIPGSPATSNAPTPVRKQPPRYEGDYNPAKLKKKSTPFPTPGVNNKHSSGEPGRWRTDIAPEFRVFNDPGLNDLDEFYPSVSIQTDFAVRWTNYFGELEVGLSHFSGTSREPRFQVELRTDEFGIPNDAVLIPIYDVIDRTGIDAQYFIGDWAWKLEAISRSGQGDRFSAATFGFEKMFVGILGTRGDLGVVAEYLFDDRGEDAPVIGEDDVALRFRYTVNNPSDTTALLVWLYDVDSDEYLMTLEASSRIGANWKMILEASMFNGGKSLTADFPSVLNAFADPESELGLFQDEDFIKLEFIRYS